MHQLPFVVFQHYSRTQVSHVEPGAKPSTNAQPLKLNIYMAWFSVIALVRE